MSYVLFLDDYRNPADVYWVAFPREPNLQIVRNLDEFIEHIEQNGIPEFITFDHDLQQNHYGNDFSDGKTGYDAAKWLVEYCHLHNHAFPKYEVHSMNPDGKNRIIGVIETNKKTNFIK